MTFSRTVRAFRRKSFARFALGLFAAALLGACSEPDLKEMAKVAEERARASLKSVDQNALTQKADADTVKQVQANLAKLNEYMGAVNGKLDPVTLNALEAFQRGQGLTPDGMLTKKTLDLLDEAAAKKG